jgi:3-hydroxyacyl-[acyl-carrier-protein] dehydratase
MPDKGFMGFSAVDGVKFRGSVQPGDRLVLIGRMVELGKRRCSAETQGYVDGKMVFQGRIEGMWLG